VCLGELRFVGLHKQIEGAMRLISPSRHPDLVKRLLCAGLLTLRQVVQDVRRLVAPAALAARSRPDLSKRLPETESAVADGELGIDREAAGLQIQEQLLPGLLALAVAALHGEVWSIVVDRISEESRGDLAICYRNTV